MRSASSIGEMLREQGGEAFFELVEGDRRAAIARREGDGAADDLRAAHRRARPPGVATDLTRAFSIWFQAVNTAEKVHRVRRRREYLNDAASSQPGGIAESIGRSAARRVCRCEQTLALIASMSIEPVFTAHPTESTRRTMLRKQQRIAQDLLDRLNPALTRAETETLWARVRLEITSIWQTEEHPREGLTVADEREHVLFYLIEILYRVVPLFYEEIESALARAYGVPRRRRSSVPSILHFGSWVGGDMDGNADVHGKTIRETLHRHQQLIVSTYFEECGRLAETLEPERATACRFRRALQRRIEAYMGLLPGAQELAPARHDRQPYRIFFSQLRERLKATYDGRPNAYQSSDELLADIQLASDSLIANRGRHAGHFLVRRFIRRVRTFGFHLATLDITQHARVHDEVIAQGIGAPEWPGLPPGERLLRLRDLLARDQGPTGTFDAVGRRSLWVFEAIAHARHKYGGRSIGDYIVSGAEGPEDVLAVLLLARWADITDKRTGECPLDVAPLLESISALERAGEVLRGLQAEPAYRQHLAMRGNRQQMVVGYSDTNKEGGIAASRWALQVAQIQLLDAAREAGITLIDLSRPRRHSAARRRPYRTSGGGGAAGRRARRAAPHRAGRGGEPELWAAAHRHAHAGTHVRGRGDAPRPAWHQPAAARRPARRPCRHMAPEQPFEPTGVWPSASPQFFDFFRAATPLDVIERMHIGSRPAMRTGSSGLPALAGHSLGVRVDAKPAHAAGLVRFRQRSGGGRRRNTARWCSKRMLADWPFFGHLLDDVEAMLARTDLDIAAHYDALSGGELKQNAAQIRQEFDLTVHWVLMLRGTERLLDSDPTLQRVITLRNPYVDPMHLMQVDLLKRWRATERQDDALFAALRATISGIAQGLQATG